MKERFNNRMVATMAPYFVLALAVILAYKVVTEISFFTGIIGRVWGIVTPFFYGFILAYILNIPCGGIRKLINKIKFKFINKRQKALSIIIVYILSLLLVIFVIYMLVPYIVSSVSLFIQNFPAYYEGFLQLIHGFNNLELFDIYFDTDSIAAMFQELLSDLSGFVNITSSLTAIMVGVSTAIFRTFLIVVSSIFFLIEKDSIRDILVRMLKAFSPAKFCSPILMYSGRLNKNFKQYIHTQTIDGIILGSIATVELLIMRSPFALVLGLMLGIINYIPYFGSIIGSLIAVVVVAFTQGIGMAAIAAVVLLITQQIDGNVIQPKLMGGSFSLSPLLVIISITVGGAFAGVLGMIAAIPIVAVLKDILDNIILYYEKKRTGAETPAND